MIPIRDAWSGSVTSEQEGSSTAEIWGIATAAVAGGAISAIGAEGAAGEQASAAENAQQISENEFNTITAQESPWMQAGGGAQSQLNYLLGIGGPSAGANTNSYVTAGTNTAGGGYGSLLSPFTTQNFQQLSPAYNFQLQQGQQGVLNQDASSTGALSGSAYKDLMNYNQNLANTSFNNAFNQYQTQQGNIYQRLAGISQLGQSAAANTGQQGTALAGQAAQSATNVGTALAGGTVGASNAISSGLSSAALPWLLSSSTPGTSNPYADLGG
jgi:hypothetical protein